MNHRFAKWLYSSDRVRWLGRKRWKKREVWYGVGLVSGDNQCRVLKSSISRSGYPLCLRGVFPSTSRWLMRKTGHLVFLMGLLILLSPRARDIVMHSRHTNCWVSGRRSHHLERICSGNKGLCCLFWFAENGSKSDKELSVLCSRQLEVAVSRIGCACKSCLESGWSCDHVCWGSG